jgi:hypothetical protein
MATVNGNLNGRIGNKTNVIAAAMIILGALSDPLFQSIMPAEYAPKILFFGGLLLSVIRIFSTGQKKVDPTDMSGAVK